MAGHGWLSVTAMLLLIDHSISCDQGPIEWTRAGGTFLRRSRSSGRLPPPNALLSFAGNAFLRYRHGLRVRTLQVDYMGASCKYFVVADVSGEAQLLMLVLSKTRRLPTHRIVLDAPAQPFLLRTSTYCASAHHQFAKPGAKSRRGSRFPFSCK